MSARIVDNNGTLLGNFAPREVPQYALGPQNTHMWPFKPNRPQDQKNIGPIYLHNGYYVLSTEENTIPNVKCLCVGGMLRIFQMPTPF